MDTQEKWPVGIITSILSHGRDSKYLKIRATWPLNGGPRMDGPSVVQRRVFRPPQGRALALSCWNVRRSWAGPVSSSGRSRDDQGCRTPRLQAAATYQSVQSKLSVSTSAQSAGWRLTLVFAKTVWRLGILWWNWGHKVFRHQRESLQLKSSVCLHEGETGLSPHTREETGHLAVRTLALEVASYNWTEPCWTIMDVKMAGAYFLRAALQIMLSSFPPHNSF